MLLSRRRRVDESVDSLEEGIKDWGGNFTVAEVAKRFPHLPEKKIHEKLRSMRARGVVESMGLRFIGQGKTIATYRVVPEEFRLPPSAEEFLRQRMGNMRYA